MVITSSFSLENRDYITRQDGVIEREDPTPPTTPTPKRQTNL